MNRPGVPAQDTVEGGGGIPVQDTVEDVDFDSPEPKAWKPTEKPADDPESEQSSRPESEPDVAPEFFDKAESAKKTRAPYNGGKPRASRKGN